MGTEKVEIESYVKYIGAGPAARVSAPYRTNPATRYGLTPDVSTDRLNSSGIAVCVYNHGSEGKHGDDPLADSGSSYSSKQTDGGGY